MILKSSSLSTLLSSSSSSHGAFQLWLLLNLSCLVVLISGDIICQEYCSSITNQTWSKKCRWRSKCDGCPECPVPRFECPASPSDPPIIIPSNITRIKITRSPPDHLCTLTSIPTSDGGDDDDTVITPLARSYDGYEWEITSSSVVMTTTPLIFSCRFNYCAVTIPASLLSESSTLLLTTVAKRQQHPISPSNNDDSHDNKSHSSSSSSSLIARFLEQATFGPTRHLLSTLQKTTFTSWIQSQIDNVPPSYHRSHFRRRVHTPLSSSRKIGPSFSPCEMNSHYQSYAFHHFDKKKKVSIRRVVSTNPTTLLLSIDGYPRTEITNLSLFDGGTLPLSGSYRTCRINELVGGLFELSINGGCRRLVVGNPPIRFNSTGMNEDYVLTLPPGEDYFREWVEKGRGEYLLREEGRRVITRENEETCGRLENYKGKRPVFLKWGSDWLLHVPYLSLKDNSIEEPYSGHDDDDESSLCPNAVMTKWNSHSCQLSSTACHSPSYTSTTPLTLNNHTLRMFYETTGRFVYAVQGLRPVSSPCHVGSRSRWLKLNECPKKDSSFTIDDETRHVLETLLIDAFARFDGNSLLDIHLPHNNLTCRINDRDILSHRISLPVKSSCYELVHPDHHSVYDFTDWAGTNAHPGNAVAKSNRRSNPIERFANNGEVMLQFPSHHPMEHWTNGRSFLVYLGRYNETVNRVDIPDHLRVVVAKSNGSNSSATTTIACGSPGESSNNISSTEGFTVATDDTSHMGNHSRNNARRSTFLSMALNAPDQLRQRVAWALSQLFPMSPLSIGIDGSSEPFLNYHDIFVRNAFGSFGEVLEEVSYSPMMGEMLSHVKSKSTAYHYERTNVVYPDENFAREIMQLFTIGTIFLNQDGTPQLDKNRRPIPTYDNDNIMTFSRAWTGFDRQFSRGNIEDVGGVNRIDPMMIVPEWRDAFPKMDLMGGYIGDGYPLCGDVWGGPKGFLNEGARYVWRGVGDNSVGRGGEGLVEIKVTSNLFSQLCGDNATIFEDCRVTNPVIILETTIPCHAEECTVETFPRGVLIGSKIVFDIIPPPCVTLSFYNDGRMVKRGDVVSCANSKDKTAIRDNDDGAGNEFHWSDEPCEVLIKIHNDGKIAMVHHHLDDDDDDDDNDYAMHLAFRKNTPHFFQVDWNDNQYPTVQNNQCSTNSGLDCTVTDDNCCLCHVHVVEEPIIDLYILTMYESDVMFDRETIESKLHIGSIDPTMFGDIYQSPPIRINDDISLYLPTSYQKDNYLLDDHSIIIGINGQYFKNLQSRIHITSSSSKSNPPPPSFRNPPQFINILNPTIPSVTYETDAVLHHLFHHQNVPPFISRRLIQRLTYLSNPSPRYISTVSRAFRTGYYYHAVETDEDDVSFGTGRYGDLAATVAAILLDREVRIGGDLLEMDGVGGYGGLKEPLVKLVGFMRAMEFEKRQSGWEVELDYVFEKIGQMAHDAPDVFSFFSPDYAPPGRISSSGLVSPEAQVSIIAPNIIGLLNGLFSMIKYGLVVCDDGFGVTFYRSCRNEGDMMSALGTLNYIPQGFEDVDTDGSMVVDELATLLTAGRLNEPSRRIMSKAYDDAKDRNAGLRLVQQLFLSTAEFHSTNVVEPTDKMRGDDNDKQEQESDTTSGMLDERKNKEENHETEYKAVILLSLWGGCDSYNMLVPLSNCHDDNHNEKDLYQEYRNVRGQMALSKEVLLPISVTSSSPPQVCDNFGLHPNLPHLKNLYDQNDALFIANAGALTEPVTNKNYRKTQTELFAHNTQTQFAEQLNPFSNASSPTGILGRMNDVLSRKGYRTGSMSLDKRSDALVGRKSHIAYVNPLTPFNPHPSTTTINSLMKQLNNATTSSSSGSIFADTWSDAFVRSIDQNQILVDATKASSIKTTFPMTGFGQDFELIAKLISSSQKRRTNRDFFHIKLGGFDMHIRQGDRLSANFETLNDAIGAFVDEMKLTGQWNNVVVIEHSDFGRTLTPNSSEGTDHGWGGNYFMFGGAVRGGRIIGTYPDNLTEDERSEINIGRGRLVPTTSWEAVWNGVARWMGVEEENDLMEVLPNRLSFKDGLFSDDDLFMSLNPRRNKARRMLIRKHEKRRLRNATGKKIKK